MGKSCFPIFVLVLFLSGCFNKKPVNGSSVDSKTRNENPSGTPPLNITLPTSGEAGKQVEPEKVIPDIVHTTDPNSSEPVKDLGFRILESNVTNGPHTSTYDTASHPAFDWFVQDVCLNEHGNPTSDDPSTCARKRNLKIGEDVLYIHHNIEHDISLKNVPLMLGNAVRVHAQFDRAPFRSQSHGDVYDVLEGEGNIASTTSTSMFEWTRFWGRHEGSGDWTWQDGWVLFPLCVLFQNCPMEPVDKGYNRGTYNISGGTDTERWGNDFTYTWYGRGPFTYSSGKVLESVYSYHSNASSLADVVEKANNGKLSLEIYYFTKEYGLTRYENWNSPARCMVLFNDEEVCPEGNKSRQCNGAPSTLAYSTNGSLVGRSSCEDTSEHKELDLPLHPYWSGTSTDGLEVKASEITTRNLLHSGDFSRESTTGWTRYGESANWSVLSEEKNYFLRANCGSIACDKAQSIYQDLSPKQITETFYGYSVAHINAGALLRASVKGAQATLVVYLDSTPYMQKIQLSTEWNAVRFNFKADLSKVRNIRYQLFMHDPQANYDIDETYLAPMP